MTASQVLVGAFVPQTLAMGPGSRACLWVAGCSINCRGCTTPELIGTERGVLHGIEEVCAWIDQAQAEHGVEGVSFSGGEPFEQAEALAVVARHARSKGLSTLSWSGFVRRHLEGERGPPGANAFIAELDVLIDGPFLDTKVNGDPLRGSSNQVIHRLTERYAEADFDQQRVIDVQLPRKDGEEIIINGVADSRKMRILLKLYGV